MHTDYISTIWHTETAVYTKESLTTLLIEQRVLRPTDTIDHPDITLVLPEKEKTTISIEQIRQATIPPTTRVFALDRHFVIITPADSLSLPAAQALLKSLEEPPRDTAYILITHRVALLPPTIVSRCRIVEINGNTLAETETVPKPQTIGECIKLSDTFAADKQRAIALLTTIATASAKSAPHTARAALLALRKISENCNPKLTLDTFFFTFLKK